MQFLAAAATSAQSTVLEKLRHIPLEFWWKMGIGIVALILVVVVLRKVANINKVVLAVGVFLVGTFVGFSWIYERNEPTWASPAVQWLAGFFPSKGKIEEKMRS